MSRRTKKKLRRKKPGCSGKVRHKDRVGALIARRKMKNEGLDVYGPCVHCGGWHVGHSNKEWRIQKRLDQLMGKDEG